MRQARQFWDNSRPSDCGPIIFDHISRKNRPLWAADILDLAKGRIPVVPSVELVLNFARQPEQWILKTRIEAHDVVRAVQRFRHERQFPHGSLFDRVLGLAVNVAKVTFNARGYPGGFDHDAGWYIASYLKAIVDKVNDPVFAENAWNALCA